MLLIIIIISFIVDLGHGYLRMRPKPLSISMSLRKDFKNIKNSIKNVVSQIEDDGYNKSYNLKGIVKLLDGFKNRYVRKVKPGHLILIRHGESEWNGINI